MKASEIFTLIVRVIGLTMALSELGKIARMIIFEWGLVPRFLELLIKDIPTLLIGLWFLRGAPKLIKFAYPEEK